MIGRELISAHGLVEWFLAQEGKRVRGFKRAVFSGFTTQALAGLLDRIISEYPELSGVWQVAAAPINKFDLLSLIREVYELNVEIEPDDSFNCDRSLDGARFCKATGFTPSSWPEMIRRMRDDSTLYNELRRINADG
jgi:dTDP-4-dehydrorhamnose reductase